MVPEINIWSWDKVPPHLQKYLYAGRIFCFEFARDTYCFGRIMTKTLVGHIAEIFTYTSPLPEISEEIYRNAKRLCVVILDTPNLFERNKNRSWRVIGDHKSHTPENVSGINYSISKNKKVDFFGKITDITEKEFEKLPPFIPLGEDAIKQIIAPLIGKEFCYSEKKTANKKAEIELWGWEKKPRTMLRYLDAGQIFCFEFDKDNYCFGRLMTKCCVGYIAEIFDIVSPLPEISADQIKNAKRTDIQILAAYSLFDRRSEGDWRIIGICNNYIPTDVEGIIFHYGLGTDTRITDFFDHETRVSESEAHKFPPLSPHGDYLIKKSIAEKLF